MLARWRNVLYSDKPNFQLRREDGLQRVWRRAEERNADVTVARRVVQGGERILVRAGISYRHRIQMHVIVGNLNAVRYHDEILRPIVLPFVWNWDGFLLVHFGCYLARLVAHVQLLPWLNEFARLSQFPIYGILLIIISVLFHHGNCDYHRGVNIYNHSFWTRELGFMRLVNFVSAIPIFFIILDWACHHRTPSCQICILN